MHTYMGTCDNTTDFPVDLSMTFLALGLLHIKSKMAGVYTPKNSGPLSVKNDSSLIINHICFEKLCQRHKKFLAHGKNWAPPLTTPKNSGPSPQTDGPCLPVKNDSSLKVPVNLRHFSRHDLAYLKARYSIF